VLARLVGRLAARLADTNAHVAPIGDLLRVLYDDVHCVGVCYAKPKLLWKLGWMLKAIAIRY